MDRRLLAAQLILSAVDGRDTLPERTRALLAEIPPGGILLFSYNLGRDPERSKAFIGEVSACVARFSLAPFVASDQEGGSVQRFRGRAALPAPLSYWQGMERELSSGGSGAERAEAWAEARRATLLAIENHAAEAGQELRRLGVNFNLAPVAEFLSEENRPFLKDRSYSPDPVFTGEAAAAFIRGMERAGIAATLKHFPGNSGADPHRSRAVLASGDPEPLVAPFRYVVGRENPAAVMVSHVVVPSWDSRPSSLSPAAVGRLRALGFEGIILADDFTMAAAGAPVERCAVEALNAGVDMVMAWPADLAKIHRAVLEALERKELPEEKLRKAAERIILQKLRYGLIH
jgi:beta-N-acetylhexosaminidase